MSNGRCLLHKMSLVISFDNEMTGDNLVSTQINARLRLHDESSWRRGMLSRGLFLFAICLVSLQVEGHWDNGKWSKEAAARELGMDAKKNLRIAQLRVCHGSLPFSRCSVVSCSD